eukprot:gene3114-13125_t
MLLRHITGVQRVSSLQTFSDYRRTETGRLTGWDGSLVEYETLELRLNPPQVEIDNNMYDDMTVVTIDSANRPGTLVEVVMSLTELGLSIRRARISSDEFYVTETPKGKVTDPRKVAIIKKMLDVDATQATKDIKDSQPSCTVFELSGNDHTGLLAAVVQLLAANGCELLTAAVWTFNSRVALVVWTFNSRVALVVWTFNSRVALVVSARDCHGGAVADTAKLQRLQQTLFNMLVLNDASPRNTESGFPLPTESSETTLRSPSATASVTLPAAGAINTRRKEGSLSKENSVLSSSPRNGRPSSIEKRESALNQLPSATASVTLPVPGAVGIRRKGDSLGKVSAPPTLLVVPEKVNFSRVSAPQLDLQLPRNNYSDSEGHAEVQIRHSVYLNYWLVTIQCKDRNKLFFDTVCTITDMNYDVFHGTIDSEGDLASQLFYVRPRYGECIRDMAHADKLKYLLESAVLRRHPKGLNMSLKTGDQVSMCEILQTFGRAGYSITSAEVVTVGTWVIHNLSLVDEDGGIPPPAPVQRACEAVGGMLVADVDVPLGGVRAQASKLRFTFSFPANLK